MTTRKTFATALFASLLLVSSASAQQAKPKKDPDVPYVPTTERAVEEMLKLANIKSSDVIYDLGCGDGRIVIMAVEKFGARGVGIDIDPKRIEEARANASRAGVADRAEFRLGNLFDADIRAATVVTLYLLPEVNLRLKPKLRADLAPGTRVVSHDFSMGDDWPPERTLRLQNDTLFLWTVPAR